MTERIIALVDGSGYAASVCDHAAWMAKGSGAGVELLHVLGRREAEGQQDLSGAIALGARTALLEELAALDAQRARLMTEQGRVLLEDSRQRIAAAGVAETATRLRHGDLLEAVAEAERGAAAITIGKRGAAADFASGHLGSNLERVLRASHRPVLVASRAFRPIRRALLAHDGGTSARKAVEHVAQSPLFRDVSVRLVTVGTDTAETRGWLAEAQLRLAGVGIATETALLPDSAHPETALAGMIETEGFDLLIMGAYGHSRIRALIIGSTTTALTRACKVPVLLLR